MAKNPLTPRKPKTAVAEGYKLPKTKTEIYRPPSPPPSQERNEEDSSMTTMKDQIKPISSSLPSSQGIKRQREITEFFPECSSSDSDD